MSADIEMPASRPNGVVDTDRDHDHVPSTPPAEAANRHASSQQSIPSTEGPASPLDPSASFKSDLNDDRNSPRIIPSSLTPPPSSQVPKPNAASGMPPGYITSQRANMFSPPTTTLRRHGRDNTNADEYLAPTSDQLADASADQLRTMVASCVAENARLKTETAHHRLQYRMMSIQATEEANRAAVELAMADRSVDFYRESLFALQARRELNSPVDTIQIKYRELQNVHEAARKKIETLERRLKASTKVIRQRAEEIDSLVDDRDMLLTRIRENREHFHMLCSPGFAFHGVLTPKTPTTASPQQYRGTPRQTPKPLGRGAYHGPDPTNIGLLLEAMNQNENNSAPSTPLTSSRPAPRMPPRHTRGVQSMSSLPTTPSSRPSGIHTGLLPSVDLVPRTEPPRFVGSGRYGPETPMQKRNHKSRESTISADDNEELARAAVAAATTSIISQSSHASQRREAGEEEVYESQASQAASELLRRDPRESFEVASSVGSRDGTPAPAEKTAKLQSKLFAGLNKAGLASEKRKFSGGLQEAEEVQRGRFTSPTKKMKFGADGEATNHRVGLGIRYGHGQGR
ncbi:Uu.00g121560.m01.CDS01 [Anthostomella pinea]|uniref:Uu.00g121560.m01.CDS01 n=1 Tax=Anthostomella pinea TaxID=933095 RepID=A0AAI8VBS2_9PEZI|nr:Uu.00g121560.m01.CDS01 [Anthostomella pinea]